MTAKTNRGGGGLIATGAMRQWRPWLKKRKLTVRCGKEYEALPGGVKHVALRARVLKYIHNVLVLDDNSNALNRANRTGVPAEVAARTPALISLAAKGCGERPADHVWCRVDLRVHRMITCLKKGADM